MITLLLWLNHGEIMEVGEGSNFGIPQDSMMQFEFSVGFPVVIFSNGCLYYDAFFEVLKKSLKGEKSVPKCSKYKDR